MNIRREQKLKSKSNISSRRRFDLPSLDASSTKIEMFLSLWITDLYYHRRFSIHSSVGLMLGPQSDKTSDERWFRLYSFYLKLHIIDYPHVWWMLWDGVVLPWNEVRGQITVCNYFTTLCLHMMWLKQSEINQHFTKDSYFKLNTMKICWRERKREGPVLRKNFWNLLSSWFFSP